MALLVVLGSTGEAALPPGYDEELWCPNDTCLRPRAQPQGWVGPRSSFNECAGSSGETHRPREWGEKVGADARAHLVAEGYTQSVCGEPEPRQPPGRRRRWEAAGMESVAIQPRPNALEFSGEHRLLGRSFTISLIDGAESSALIRAAALRFLERLQHLSKRGAAGLTGGSAAGSSVELDRAALTLRRPPALDDDSDGRSANDAVTTLVLRCTEADPMTLSLDQAEGYTMKIQGRSAAAPDATIEAKSVVGVLQGLEAVAQLAFTASEGHGTPRLPVVIGTDSPRFPWRGLLVDVARHFMPLETLETIIDGAAALRMNVLHLHLTDDQGWRFQSTAYPEFHLAGTDSSRNADAQGGREYYTPQELQSIVAYARERGLRVVPEVGFPAHATSLLLARPDLGPPDTTAPSALADTWGVHQTCLDVRNEEVYKVVSTLFEELAAVFPDECARTTTTHYALQYGSKCSNVECRGLV